MILSLKKDIDNPNEFLVNFSKKKSKKDLGSDPTVQ